MKGKDYKFVKDVQRRLENGEPTTFGERVRMNIILKADKKRKAENVRKAMENVQVVCSNKF